MFSICRSLFFKYYYFGGFFVLCTVAFCRCCWEVVLSLWRSRISGPTAVLLYSETFKGILTIFFPFLLKVFCEDGLLHLQVHGVLQLVFIAQTVFSNPLKVNKAKKSENVCSASIYANVSFTFVFFQKG